MLEVLCTRFHTVSNEYFEDASELNNSYSDIEGGNEKKEPPCFQRTEECGFTALKLYCEEICVAVVCVVSKISTLITFGSVCMRVHSGPNRKYSAPAPVPGCTRGAACMVTNTSLKVGPNIP